MRYWRAHAGLKGPSGSRRSLHHLPRSRCELPHAPAITATAAIFLARQGFSKDEVLQRLQRPAFSWVFEANVSSARYSPSQGRRPNAYLRCRASSDTIRLGVLGPDFLYRERHNQRAELILLHQSLPETACASLENAGARLGDLLADDSDPFYLAANPRVVSVRNGQPEWVQMADRSALALRIWLQEPVSRDHWRELEGQR